MMLFTCRCLKTFSLKSGFKKMVFLTISFLHKMFHRDKLEGLTLMGHQTNRKTNVCQSFITNLAMGWTMGAFCMVINGKTCSVPLHFLRHVETNAIKSRPLVKSV